MPSAQAVDHGARRGAEVGVHNVRACFDTLASGAQCDGTSCTSPIDCTCYLSGQRVLAIGTYWSAFQDTLALEDTRQPHCDSQPGVLDAITLLVHLFRRAS